MNIEVLTFDLAHHESLRRQINEEKISCATLRQPA